MGTNCLFFNNQNLIIFCRYPFEPPCMRFITPVYHPNVDVAGRICLDLLRLPPKGTWRPVITLSGLLTSLQMLLTQPNPDDPLMTDIVSIQILCIQKFWLLFIILYCGTLLLISSFSTNATGSLSYLKRVLPVLI